MGSYVGKLIVKVKILHLTKLKLTYKVIYTSCVSESYKFQSNNFNFFVVAYLT